MDEIQNKYVLDAFKKRTNKQKALKFEDIDLDVYRPSAHCATFTTQEERIFHWIRTFQFHYYETLKDNDEYLVQRIGYSGYDGSTFQEIEIQIDKVDSNEAAPSPGLSQPTVGDNNDPCIQQQLLITIHLYLTTGVIMFQGCAFKFWAEKEFAILQKLTDSSVCAQQQEIPDTDNIPDNESLLENLSHALGSLLCKKTKPKVKKTNQTNEGNNQDPRNATTSASLVTPLMILIFTDLNSTLSLAHFAHHFPTFISSIMTIFQPTFSTIIST